MSPDSCPQIGRMVFRTPKVSKNANSINWAEKVRCDRIMDGVIERAAWDPGVGTGSLPDYFLGEIFSGKLFGRCFSEIFPASIVFSSGFFRCTGSARFMYARTKPCTTNRFRMRNRKYMERSSRE
jgi:hypothetical protein